LIFRQNAFRFFCRSVVLISTSSKFLIRLRPFRSSSVLEMSSLFRDASFWEVYTLSESSSFTSISSFLSSYREDDEALTRPEVFFTGSFFLERYRTPARYFLVNFLNCLRFRADRRGSFVLLLLYKMSAINSSEGEKTTASVYSSRGEIFRFFIRSFLYRFCF
jgi:hypothetical protein